MADITNSLYGMICEIVRQETIYHRHYIGKVLSRDDSTNLGCVRVSVPDLGWDTADMAPMCYPRQLHSMTVPEVGEWVEVYFLNGDRNRPVYLCLCAEMKDESEAFCIPEWYTGDPMVRVIYQSPTSGKGIVLDDTSGEMKIDAETIMLIDGSTEPFVLGTQLNTWLSNFVTTIFNLHTHLYAPGPGTPIATGAPVPTGSAPSGILSTKIKGQ